MGAPVRHLTADRGAPFDLALRQVDPGGAPVDVTGHTISLDLYDRWPDPPTPERIPATTGPDGWIFVAIPAITTLDQDAYTYRLVDTTTNTVLLTGRLTIRRPENV